MKDKCKICERDTGGFEYCNEFCEIQGLRSQLEDARELEKKAFWSALDITDDDFNSRDTWSNSFNEVKQIFWDEYQEQLKEQGDETKRNKHS